MTSPAPAEAPLRFSRTWQADELRDLTPVEALDVFRGGADSASLAPVEGDPIGIGIGFQHFRRGGFLDRRLRRWAASPGFPWEGKSFRAESPERGVGFNRIRRGPILTIAPFKTYLAPSIVDQRPAIVLDYDVPRNPWWERRTYDEIREISPRLFLGFTAYRIFGRKPIFLWFALDNSGGAGTR